MPVKTSLALALAALGCAAAPADAALKRWALPASGAFAASDQWRAAGKPRRADNVLFDLSGAYSVRFAGHQVNSRLIVGNDKLLLRLEGKRYALTSSRLEALLLGRRAGNVSRLTVRDGTFITPRSTIGKVANAQGHMTVSNTTWNTRSTLVVGERGGATMTAISRSTVNSTSAILGSHATGKGNVILSGQGTTWNIANTLNIAPAGSAMLTVRPGAALNVGNTLHLNGAGALRLQGGSLSAGVLQASGGRLTLDSGTTQVGSGTLGTGAAMVVNGGQHQFGTLNVQGKLAMNNVSARLNATHMLNTGQIVGQGEIVGDITNASEVSVTDGQTMRFGGRFTNAGLVSALEGSTASFDADVIGTGQFGGGGQFRFGRQFSTGGFATTGFDGDVEFTSTGSLLLNVGGIGQHDLLSITGTALLNDVLIRVDGSYAGPGGFVPLVNSAQLTYGGTITLDTGGLDVRLVREGQTLGVILPVPEPGTASLVGVGAAIALLRRRRMKV